MKVGNDSQTQELGCCRMPACKPQLSRPLAAISQSFAQPCPVNRNFRTVLPHKPELSRRITP